MKRTKGISKMHEQVDPHVICYCIGAPPSAHSDGQVSCLQHSRDLLQNPILLCTLQ